MATKKNDDIVKFKEPVNLSVDLEKEHMYHWEVNFEVQIDKANLDDTDPELAKAFAESGDEKEVWMADVLIVRGPDDAQAAIDKAKAYVTSGEAGTDYEFPVINFLLTGVRLLSAADI
jgi:hypothetical protein